ncbi:MAG: helix-turn-helix domain-containing protein [Streptosporangiales bacterium]|nr:helix-turn-helix domain-containing protein [Streptosporangiales bacterium]
MVQAVLVNELIGERVRQHRTARGWTLDELTERSGVSRRMLISIEHGEGNPSIATLLRISDALGVGLPVLVDVERPRALTITTAGQAPVLWRGPRGGQALLVAGTEPPDVVELWDWTLHPGEEHHSEAHSVGTRELLLVLDGRVNLRVEDRTDRLEAGDSATFAGDVAHGYATPADAATLARFALTVFQPNVREGRK